MISNTLYAKFIMEREGLSILENEVGFITYKIMGSECYLSNMFIDRDARGTGKGRALLKELEKIARGCDFITANIWMWDPNKDKTLQAALASGFKLTRATEGVLLISKNLKE